jgi:protease-4
MEQQPTNNNQGNQQSKMDVFFKYVKNIFFLLIVVQFAPIVFSGLKTLIEDSTSAKVQVGVLNITGILTDASFYERKIEQFSKSSDIKGLILKINSPGGYPGTAQEIFNELKKFKKPIVVVVENMCTSAAYYIAAGGNYIVCNPSSMVGSIGVLLELPNVKDLLNSWKIKFNYIQSGTYKTAGSPLKETSEEERVYLQSLADDTYKQFIADVATSRKISEKEFPVWANGKVFTGNQALKLKLVDKLGSLSDGVSEMKKRLNIDEATEIKLIQPKRTTGLLALLKDDEEYTMESNSTLADRIACFSSDVYQKFMLHQKQQTPNLQ